MSTLFQVLPTQDPDEPKITLNWTDTNDNEDGFAIERKMVTETEFVQVATVGLTNQYIDTGMDPGITYEYRIYAFNAYGDGPLSNLVSATLTEPCTPMEITVDDTGSPIDYSGSWNAQSGWSGRYLLTIHETDVVGAYAEMVFMGDSVELIADLQPWGGDADILIDGLLDSTISFNGDIAYQQVVYSKTGLSMSLHTIRVVCQGGGWTYVDAFEYFGCLE